MTALRAFLVLAFATIAGYTAIVIAHHGLGLFAVFFGDLASVTWPGQFDLDFLCLLTLSAIWVAHRHRFRPIGLLLGLCALVGGVLFLSVYLLVAAARANGDAGSLLLGEHRRAR
ncbi:MAG TPA: hypothetical protein VFP84_03220 [Kofleriaceae bacterium]|nr:hypothetical protein [Kofleriaceae bacterium]